MTSRKLWLIRLIVSATLLGALTWIVPLADFWTAARNIPALLALGALVGFLLGHLVAATKWWLLMSSHTAVSLRLALQAHFAGLTANLCLPGIAGGDVVRAAWVMRNTHGKAGIGVASLADRLLDCLALLVLSCVGMAWTSEFSGPIGTSLWIASAIVFTPFLLIGVAYLVLRRYAPDGRFGRIIEALGVLARHPGALLRSFLLSLLVQTGFLAWNVVLGRTAGVDVDVSAWLVAWPLAKLIALAPLSLNGLGVREAALVFFMRPFGALPAAVAATSLYWQIIITIGSLIGGLTVTMPNRIASVTRETATAA